MASFLPPPGTSDIFPEEIPRWNFLKQSADKIFSLYGFGEIRTPVFEYTEVFQKSIGDETDVVKKEMYTFLDRGGRSLTLRPEGTAGVMRALMKTDVLNGVEKRVYYFGSMFRGERPAAGRKRQFHQVGVENAGKTGPAFDAENIIMLMHYLDEIKITGCKLLINTRGTAVDREPAAKKLYDYFNPLVGEMCPDCKERINSNIWRILDCKSPECKNIVNSSPNIAEYFTGETQNYFKKVIQILETQKIDFTIDSKLVRGLDYYQHTVFEVVHDGLGGQNAIAGGGNYSIQSPGSKKKICGVGFAAGLERLIMAQDACSAECELQVDRPVYLVSLGENAVNENIKLIGELRKQNIYSMMELDGVKSMKSQMRSASRNSSNIVIIRGEEELAEGIAVVKNMAEGSQKKVQLNDLINLLKS